MALSQQFMAAVGEAMKDLLLAHVASALADIDINILGVDLHPFEFLRQWAADLEAQASQAINDAAIAQTGVNTVAQGVTGPITGTASSNPADVQPAVNQLNTQVQTLGGAPALSIFNGAGTYSFSVPTNGKTIDFECVGPGGGGARGGTSGGSGLGGGGGGPGGYTRVFSMRVADLPSTNLTITLGAPGAGATSDATNGGDGAVCTISWSGGTLFQWGGGLGGLPGGGGSYGATGAAGFGTEYSGASGGSGGYSTSQIPGQAGGPGHWTAGGAGGSSPGSNGSPGVSPP
ncbi:glycine-rich domain-containing protein, partial [Nocardia pseudovaccinii]|uniref:glycine-rich domain-containing protein n=1 Tax=Nocardia pseudovaccinii TaxID=189540 RepID=UPI00403AECF0